LHFKWINNIMIPVIFDWGRDREGERRGEKGREGERRGEKGREGE
jgi:hypothetical protein